MRHIHHKFSAGLAFVLVAMTASSALAGPTRFFRQTTAKDFEEGEATASIILPTGDVVPGIKTTRVPLEAAFAWCAVLGPDARTAYFGTGDQGRIFSIDATGSGTKAKKLVEIDGAWVTSLLVLPNGSLLAGATPGGKIFRVDPKTGTARLFAKVAAEHVWALAQDPKTKTTYVATGDAGKIFALSEGGIPRLVWDSGDKHVVSLLEVGGSLLAGTSEQAILYRVRANGQAEALHDFEADEVRAIARAGNAIYLAINDFDKPTAAIALTTSAAAKGTAVVPGAAAPASVGDLPRVGQVKSKAGLYRLDDDGRVEQIMALSDGYFTSLVVDPTGDVYAAAGTQGKVYRVTSDRTVSLAVDLPERQALSLLRTKDGFLIGTGDVGGIYRGRPAEPGQASYLSKVLDADAPATWGTLRWSGSKTLVFETRSGNTAKPDKSWSEWKKLSGISASAVEGEGKVASRSSRYVQYRVALPAQTVLREASISYLPQNQRARITELSVLDADATAPRAHSPVLKLRWKVENPDKDDLVYRLYFHQEGEPVWRTLGGPDPLTKTEYDWNSESVPDGRYVVRVWASDEKANAQDRALDFSFDSTPILVDNTKPEVTDLQSRLPLITGRVRDQASPISQIEYAIDGGEWRPASPEDGLLDQRSEAFSLRLPKLAPGPHVVNVRAHDSADNVGTGRIVIQIAK